jgi:hypothetical protein
MDLNAMMVLLKLKRSFRIASRIACPCAACFALYQTAVPAISGKAKMIDPMSVVGKTMRDTGTGAGRFQLMIQFGFPAVSNHRGPSNVPVTSAY